MRRILVENARRKRRSKHGGDLSRRELDANQVAEPETNDDVLAIDQALDRLAEVEPEAAEVVKLRYFAGLTNLEAAAIMRVSPRSADRLWAYARAWLRKEVRG